MGKQSKQCFSPLLSILGPRTDGATTLAQRIQAHGWRVVKRKPVGYLIPLAQEERGLIPLLLDAQAAEEWVDADRMYPPPNWPEGQPVPDNVCGRGVAVPSVENLGFDMLETEYDTH